MPTYKYRLLGTGITNNQGIATLNKDPNNVTINGYTGVGAGKVDIIACDTNNPNNADALVSDVKEILDCIAYDYGTTASYNDDMWNSVADMTRGTSTTGTQIAKKTTAYAVTTDITDNTCIEIDIKMNPDNTSTHLMNIRDSSNTNLFNMTKGNTGLTNGEWQHYIITIIDGSVTVTNETAQVTLTGTATNPGKFALRVLTEDDTYFKDCRVYPV